MVVPSLDAPSWMFSKALSHRQKVMRLYKRCWRETQAWYYGGDAGFQFLNARYQLVLLRARFDANKDVKDMRMAQYMLADGCRQLWKNRHMQPMRFQNDPCGGSNWGRDISALAPDTVVEFYTFPEREQFPYYMNRREQRKKELLQHWHKIEEGWDDELDSIQREIPKEDGNDKKISASSKEAPPSLH